MYPIISCYDVVSNVGLRDDMCCPPVPEYLLCCSYSKFKPGSSTKVSNQFRGASVFRLGAHVGLRPGADW